MRYAWQGIKEVFSQPRYALAAALVFASVFVLAMLAPHFRLIGFIVDSPLLEDISKEITVVRLLVLSLTTLGAGTIALAAVIAASFAANVSLGVYYFRHRMPVGKTAAASAGGLVLGLLGMGCASCGSVLISAVVGGTALGLLSVLPLRGLEFGIIGAGVSVGATYVTARKIADPAACRL